MSKIEDNVCDMIQQRAAVGLKKYGVTLERTDLSVKEWLQHLLEEQLDAACYTMKIIMQIDGEAKP